MFRKIFIFLGILKSKHKVPLVDVDPLSNDCIISVDVFNNWFNDPLNNAVYAHSGIFMRLDKLSFSHVEDYLDKKHDINRQHPLYADPLFYLLLCDFHEDIRKDWIRKSK